MRNYCDVLVKPMISEKTIGMIDENKYTFVVAMDANKIEIAHAVEEAFKVKVVDVTTKICKGKVKSMGRYSGKRPDIKKAVVTLREGDSIEMFSGL
ncbi:MAG: 50S ribosomal protein L23 [Firmicutes bacterium]|nr:50S ribosomal protein L23 [Bacillota bacterium]